MSQPEFRDWLVHVAGAERERQRDPKLAAQLAVLLRDGSFRFVEVGENPGTVLVEALPGLGEVQTPRGSPQQLHPQPLFEH